MINVNNVYFADFNHRITNEGIGERTILVTKDKDLAKSKNPNCRLATFEELKLFMSNCEPCEFGEVVNTLDGIVMWDQWIDMDIDGTRYECGEYVLVG